MFLDVVKLIRPARPAIDSVTARLHGGGGPWLIGQLRRLHCWLVPPLHDQRMIFVPFVVAAAFASTHSPDWTFVMVRLALRFHCWSSPLLQSEMTTAVPFVVPAPDASRHLLPY